MPQGAFLTQRIIELITEIHLEHPGDGPTEVRKELFERMKKEGLDRNSDPDWPGISAVTKTLKDIRDEESRLGSDPRDEPWSILSLADYEIPPDTLDEVMRIQAYAIRHRNPLTIREALWVSRLYHIVKKIAAVKNIEDERKGLEILARKYAMDERISKVLADKSRYPDKETEMWVRQRPDAYLYFLMTRDMTLWRIVDDQIKRHFPQFFSSWEEISEQGRTILGEDPLLGNELRIWLEQLQKEPDDDE